MYIRPKKMSEDAKTKTVPIYIDSNDRDKAVSKSSTDFVIKLHKTIRNVRRVDIATIEINHSWYNIDINNNSILLLFDINNTSAIVKITIPIGEYTIETLRSAIESALTIRTAPAVWTITFDSFNYKYTFNVSGPNTGTTLTNFYMIPSGHLWSMMGFTSNIIEVKNTFVSDGIVSMSPNKYFFIKSATLSNNINTSYVSSFDKTFVSTIKNNNFAIRIPYFSTSAVFQLPIDFFGSFTIEQNVVLLDTALRYGPGFLGIITWKAALDKNTKKVSISNTTYSFYIDNTDTFASNMFSMPKNTTAALSQTGNVIDFSMHKNVIAKISIPNTTFSSQNINQVSIIKNENDYGRSINIDSIDFQLVDAFDRSVDLNGKNISFSMLVSSNI
jgi:hypothetical protein